MRIRRLPSPQQHDASDDARSWYCLAIVRLYVDDLDELNEVRLEFARATELDANDPRVHFGLGDAHIIGNTTVRWVEGSTSSFGDFDAGHIATLPRSEGSAQ